MTELAISDDLAEALERMADGVRLLLPADVTVGTGGGAFSAAEIRRHVTNAPVVVVACLGTGTPQTRGAAGWFVQAQMALYVITRDLPLQPARDIKALQIVTTLLDGIGRADWIDAKTVGKTDLESISSSNLYSGDVDSMAVALWAIVWTQEVRLSTTHHK